MSIYSSQFPHGRPHLITYENDEGARVLFEIRPNDTGLIFSYYAPEPFHRNVRTDVYVKHGNIMPENIHMSSFAQNDDMLDFVITDAASLETDLGQRNSYWRVLTAYDRQMEHLGYKPVRIPAIPNPYDIDFPETARHRALQWVAEPLKKLAGQSWEERTRGQDIGVVLRDLLNQRYADSPETFNIETAQIIEGLISRNRGSGPDTSK